MKRHLIEQDNISSYHTSNKKLIFRIYKALTKFNNKQTEDEKILHQRKHMGGQ